MIYICALFLSFITHVYAADIVDFNPREKEDITPVAQFLMQNEENTIIKITSFSDVLRDFPNDILSRAAFFIDFDDTIARVCSAVDEIPIKLAITPDFKRTYKKYFDEALNELGECPLFYDKVYEYFQRNSHYEILDESACDFIEHLKNNGAFVKVLSGKSINSMKVEILEKIGLTGGDYIHAPGSKAAVLMDHLPRYQNIEHIVMIDNSVDHVLKGMVESMPGLFLRYDRVCTFHPYHHTTLEDDIAANEMESLQSEMQLLCEEYRKTAQR